MTNKKVKVSSEGAYLAAIVLLALAVAILSAADFGISMIVAPAYLLSMKLSVLSFGQAEYVIQAGLFIVPAHRKQGLAKAAIYEACTRANALGAKRAIVLSDQAFYFRIGFTLSSEVYAWEKSDSADSD